MEVLKHHHSPSHPSSTPTTCTDCYPIFLQMFFSTEGKWEYDADCLTFNFTDNELRGIREEDKLWEDIYEALSYASSDRVALCM